MKTKIDKSESRNKSSSPFFNSKNDSGFFGVQPKFKVGQPGDKYEVEADRVADEVVNSQSENQPFFAPAHSSNIQTKFLQEKPIAGNITPLIQRQEEEEEEEEEEMMQAKADSPLKEEYAKTEQLLNNSKRNGSSLDSETRTQMESSFGADFGGVKIHTDNTAVQMNKELGAQAFTTGNNIYFNEGKYRPNSQNGKKLLAHELTHTIQQKGRVDLNLQFTVGDNIDLQSIRFANNIALEACLDGERTLHYGSRGRPVSILQQALVDAGFPLPIHGVDGIFEDETRGALQNFQRSSSVPASGVLDSATMSSLDALFSYGAPILPSGSPSNVQPTITSETINFAPDGTSDNRTTVGVGERVRFTGNSAGNWTISEGRIIGINSGENMVWEAPAVASNPTITLTTPGGSIPMAMTVVPPNSITMTVNNNPPIPSGTLGANMENDVEVHPLNVNFGRTHWFEVPGPATNVTGYWSSYSAAQLYHHPNRNYLPFDDMNSGLFDNVAWRGGNRPFSAGTHDWIIPNKYKIDGESDAQGRTFTNTTQSFYISSTGTIMITKAGALVVRTINNTIFNL